MALSIDNMNFEPNLKWYVRLQAATSNILVELYLSLASAQARTDQIASGSSSGFGTFLPVTLTQIATTPTIKFHNDGLEWHLMVGGASGDGATVFKAGPFSDHDDISHAIYRDTEIITYRANAVINASTHLDVRHTISSVTIDEGLACNDTILLDSDAVGSSRYLTVQGIEIELTPDSMLATYTASKFEKMKR